MKWEIINTFKGKKIKTDDVILKILENRGVKTKKELNEFLDPKLKFTPESVGINKLQFKKSLERIKKAIKKNEQIIIFGDYDADGICASAILWEALSQKNARVIPYIPHRVDEGYGLSVKGIENILKKYKDTKLIITVDNGIIANESVDFANKKGIDVVITDHHTKLDKLPKAYSIIHTTRLCGAAISFILAAEVSKEKKDSFLELAGIATIADLMPLTNENRSIVKFALEKIRKTERIGLIEIFKEANVEKDKIGVYEISYIISPRINASGRIEKAMDSLRLLCTKDRKNARLLALKLGITNRRRQKITEELLNHAKEKIKGKERKKLIFVYDEIYEQGVIGLVAGKLVEEYYLPAIVLTKGEKYTKASARSISGFNIIDFIRQASEFLVDAGGHPMAAGFTVENEKLELVKDKLEKLAEKLLDEDKLVKSLRIDCELPEELITSNLLDKISKLEPFGMGNPNPVFVTKNLTVNDLKIVGNEDRHMKLNFGKGKFNIYGIWFNFDKSLRINIGDKVDVSFVLSENKWNGYANLELRVKDIKKSA